MIHLLTQILPFLLIPGLKGLRTESYWLVVVVVAGRFSRLAFDDAKVGFERVCVAYSMRTSLLAPFSRQLHLQTPASALHTNMTGALHG